MTIIEIKKNENGSHDNITADYIEAVPEGWAVIPDGMNCDNFPFGDVTAEEIEGVMTVTSWTPDTIPDPEPIPCREPTSDELMNILLGVSE